MRWVCGISAGSARNRPDLTGTGVRLGTGRRYRRVACYLGFMCRSRKAMIASIACSWT